MVVPTHTRVDGERTRAFGLACAILVLNCAVIISFLATRLAAKFSLFAEARAWGEAIIDQAQLLFGMELGAAAVTCGLLCARHATMSAWIGAGVLSVLAGVELSGAHFELAEALARHAPEMTLGYLSAVQTGKLAAYLGLGLCSLGAAALSMHLARDQIDSCMAQRLVLVIMLLALGAGLTDLTGAVVQGIAPIGRSAFVLAEMTGELLAAAMAVWLMADLLEIVTQKPSQTSREPKLAKHEPGC